ncbi:MAG: hypothetical protein R6U98_01365 [Pirellulaceae bacterium]
MERCSTQAVLPLVGFAADQVIRYRLQLHGVRRDVIDKSVSHVRGTRQRMAQYPRRDGKPRVDVVV